MTINWTIADKNKPEQAVKLYLVAHEDSTVSFAYYQQDGNGEWGFNKPGVTHWAPAPAAPAAPVAPVEEPKKKVELKP